MAGAPIESRLVTIVGGGGFVGRALAQELFSRGWRIRIAQRKPRRSHAMRALGNLGAIQFMATDITVPEDVANAVAGAQAVVNLVGILQGDFVAAHVDGARIVAEAAAAAGVPTLVHMSAIGADAESPSAYGRSKAAGEAAVRAAFPAATIARPSIIFGQGDQFTNRFAGMIRALPVVPVIAGGTRLQPVFVGDVAKALAIAVDDPVGHAGKTYELGGPDVMTMGQMNQWLADATGRSPSFVPVPDRIARILAAVGGFLPGAPITRDQLAMLQKDNVADPAHPGLAALGIRPTPLAAVASAWLTTYRRYGRFGDKVRA